MNEINGLSEKDVDKVADIMEDYLKNQILNSLGQRQINEQALRELTTYWIASTVSDLKLKGLISIDLAAMSEEALQTYFLSEDCTWNRGLKSYTQMAGFSLMEVIDEIINRNGIAKVLDIGCGQAVYLKELQDWYGEEIKCYGVSNLNQSGTETIDFKLALAEVLPEEWTGKFDLVTCFEASMYFWDQHQAFDEALRIIKPDGRLFYGTGNLKTSTNDSILIKRLNLEEFTYTCPETSERAGERYSGVWGKYVSKFIPFYEMLKTLTDTDGIFERHGKKFDLKRVGVLAWCPETLQIKGLGNIVK